MCDVQINFFSFLFFLLAQKQWLIRVYTNMRLSEMRRKFRINCDSFEVFFTFRKYCGPGHVVHIWPINTRLK